MEEYLNDVLYMANCRSMQFVVAPVEAGLLAPIYYCCMFDSNLKRLKLADCSWPLASSALT
jgi:hypothetical protein